MKANIKTKNFIAFLKLFNQTEVIKALELGDTWYKTSGYIDESILKGNHTIRAILELDYSFDGLICFSGHINGYHILFKNKSEEKILEFEIEATPSKLRNLEYKIIEYNAFSPNSFDFSHIRQYN